MLIHLLKISTGRTSWKANETWAKLLEVEFVPVAHQKKVSLLNGGPGSGGRAGVEAEISIQESHLSAGSEFPSLLIISFWW
jgi:hypothetical protein